MRASWGRSVGAFALTAAALTGCGRDFGFFNGLQDRFSAADGRADVVGDAAMDVPVVDEPIDGARAEDVADVLALDVADAADVVVDPAAPRQIAPLSGSSVTSRQPTLHWETSAGTDGAHVQLCRDRAMTTDCVEYDATGDHGRPPNLLTPGVWFWRLNGRAGDVTGSASGLVWQFTVGQLSAPVDSSGGSTLDVNGDGFADVVVGTATAGAYVYLGTPTGLAGTASRPIVRLLPSSGMRANIVASAGDVNGDGFVDVLVTDMGSVVRVYAGGPDGPVNMPLQVLSSALFEFGSSAAGVGDVNGDGYADVAVGATGSGKVAVYLGSSAGLVDATSQTLVGSARTGFGTSVASAGDVNGDGFGDVIVGAPGETAVYVYQGSADGVPDHVAAMYTHAGGNFGIAIANCGDTNNDGYDELLVADSMTNRVIVYVGSAQGLSVDAVVFGPASGSFSAPISIAGGGDINGDGYADFVIGAPTDRKAYVYLTGPGDTLMNPDATLTAPEVSAFGASVAVPGDVNGDGYSDLAVGANDINKAYLYLGSMIPLATAPATTLFGPDAGGFGASVASADAVHPATVSRCSGRPRHRAASPSLRRRRAAATWDSVAP